MTQPSASGIPVCSECRKKVEAHFDAALLAISKAQGGNGKAMQELLLILKHYFLDGSLSDNEAFFEALRRLDDKEEGIA